LVRLLRRKLAVPGNDPPDVSAPRLAALRRQLDTDLRSVLRERDFREFELDRAFRVVADMANRVASRPMITDIHSEDRLVQQTFADHLRDQLGWESVYAYNTETFGPSGTLGRASEREVVLVRDLRTALQRLNPDLPESAREQAIEKLTRSDFARSLLQHNREYYGFIRAACLSSGAMHPVKRSTRMRR